jgi:hypothetical protein
MMVASLLGFAPWASAQVAVGNEVSMNLSGNALFGYQGLFGEVDSSSFQFGGMADLTGYYHHPKFLSFKLSPYYNQSRVNSNFNSLFNAKGFTGTANLFGGSHTPVDIAFEKNWNNEGQFSLPGAPGLETHGSSQGLSIGAGAYYEGLPTLQGSYNINSNRYDILGTNTEGSGSGQVFSLSSSYLLKGFNLSGSYGNTHINQNVPLISNLNEHLEEKTRQSTTQFTAARDLWGSANWGAHLNHTDFQTDYTGVPTDQTYNSVSSYVSMQPLNRLSLSLGMNYTTNYSAFVLSSVLPQNSSTNATANPSPSPLQAIGAVPSSASSDYLEYGARAAYVITTDLSADGSVDRRTQSFFGQELDSDTVSGGLGYSHRLFRGQFATHYGISWFTVPTQDQNGLGHTASVSYAHDALGWTNSVDAQYSNSVQTALVTYNQTGYAFGLNTARTLLKRWRLTLAARLGKSNIDGLGNSEARMSNFNASVATNKFSFTGTYSRTTGNALQIGAGLTPTPIPGQVLLPNLLVFYGGSSYSLGGGFHPNRRLTITGNFVNARYHTDNVASISDNLLRRYELKSEYRFRQMMLLGGYSHVTQGVGATFTTPATFDYFYVGVSRHFDIF